MLLVGKRNDFLGAFPGCGVVTPRVEILIREQEIIVTVIALEVSIIVVLVVMSIVPGVVRMMTLVRCSWSMNSRLSWLGLVLGLRPVRTVRAED